MIGLSLRMHIETGSLWEHSYLRGDISLNIVNLRRNVMKGPLCIMQLYEFYVSLMLTTSIFLKKIWKYLERS